MGFLSVAPQESAPTTRIHHPQIEGKEARRRSYFSGEDDKRRCKYKCEDIYRNQATAEADLIQATTDVQFLGRQLENKEKIWLKCKDDDFGWKVLRRDFHFTGGYVNLDLDEVKEALRDSN